MIGEDGHSTDALAASIQSAFDAIVAKDRDGIVTSWNRGAEALYGYSAEEAVGQYIALIIPPHRRGEERDILARILAGQRIENYETERMRKDGTIVHVAVTIVPIHKHDGEILGASVVTRNLEHERAAEEKFRALLESAPDALVIATPDGRILLVNRQTEELFGYQRQDLLGEPVEVLVPERYRDMHGDHRAGFFLRPNVRPMGAGLQLFGRRRDGSEFPVEISLSPIATEDGLVVSAAIRDASERRRAEEHARRLEQMRQRRRQALELNDEVVQGLTVAQLALSLGHHEESERAISRTLAAAQHIIAQMLADETAETPLAQGDLRRKRAAFSDTDDPEV